jgi:hypothetical protein
MPSRSPALTKIVEIAHRHTGDAETMRELILAVAEVRLQIRAKTISTATHESGRVLLLYCPGQYGWQTGEWFPGGGCWISNTAARETLDPTHWLDLPPPPE